MVGIETTPNEIEKVSFNQLKEAGLERELGIAECAFAEEPAFGGFVFHHYRGYRRCLEKTVAHRRAALLRNRWICHRVQFTATHGTGPR